MKKNLFYSKMVLYEDTVDKLAEFLGITRSTLICKIEGKSEFKRTEIKLIIKRYQLTPEEVFEIFFS